MDVSYFLTLSNSQVTDELLPRIELFLLRYNELPLKIKFKKLSIFFYILMLTRGNLLYSVVKNHIVLNSNLLVTCQ